MNSNDAGVGPAPDDDAGIGKYAGSDAYGAAVTGGDQGSGVLGDGVRASE